MTPRDTGATYDIVAFIFAGRARAHLVRDNLKSGAPNAPYDILTSTTIEIDDEGTAHIPELSRRVKDVGLGVLAGTLLGMIGGPEGLLVWVVLGALVGSQIDRFRSRPIPAEDLERLAARMQPDTSALLTLLCHEQVPLLIDALAGYGAQVVTLSVGDRFSSEIEQSLASSNEDDRQAQPTCTD